MNPAIFLLIFFLSLNSFAEDIKSLSLKPQWLNLVHYKKSLFGYKSEADGMAFFLSHDGKTNPESELKASIEKLASTPKLRCQFPARYMFLIKEQLLKPESMESCREFLDFRNKIDPKSASIIFSSYYINTPASAFGHTLLRINRTTHRTDNVDQGELLDYGINYAAVMDTNNSLVYAFKGITGMFQGKFTAIPYYYKVREYSDYESRDLWEYKLNLTQDELEMMVAHLWELGHTYFDYFYLSENCSYHILSLVEVARPSLKLTTRLPFYVIPIDTIRVLFEEENLIFGSVYRPSSLTRLEYRSQGMNQSEIYLVRDLVNHPEQTSKILENKNAKDQAMYLDTAIEAFDYLNSHDLIFEKNNKKEERFKLLTSRSEVDIVSDELKVPIEKKNFPQNGHRSQRLTVARGNRKDFNNFYDINMRYALHDWLDPNAGQPPYAEIEFFNINFRYEEEHGELTKLRLNDFKIFKVSSYEPVTYWQNNLSWTGTLGVRNTQDPTCKSCNSLYTDLGGGASVGLKRANLLFTFMTKLELDYSPDFSHNGRAKFGPTLQTRWLPTEKFSLGVIWDYHWVNMLNNMDMSSPWSNPNAELRYHRNKIESYFIKYQEINKESISQIGLMRFF